jgi:hypothetical protein
MPFLTRPSLFFREPQVGDGYKPAAVYSTGAINNATLPNTTAIYYERTDPGNCSDLSAGMADILKYSSRNASYKMDPKSAVNFTKTSNSTSYNAGAITRVN